MKNRLISLLLCVAVLLCLPGCLGGGEKYGQEKVGLLAGNELALYLEQMGNPPGEIKETLALTDGQIADIGFRETSWHLSEAREIEGEAFSQELLFEADPPNVLWAYRFVLEPDPLYDVEKIKELTAEIALKAAELYGRPVPYFNRESSILDDKGNLEPEIGERGWEMWRLPGNTVMRLQMFISEQGQYICLEYRTQEGVHIEWKET